MSFALHDFCELEPGRAELERARALVADNRASAQVGDRDCWELSRALLRCGACGRSISAYRRRKAEGRVLYYYRCQPPSAAHACANRKSHPAEQLEYEATRLFEDSASQETLLELYDRAIEQQNGSGNESRIWERRAALSERLSTLATMRDKFQRQEAEDLMTLDELRERLTEIEEEKVCLTAELRAVEDEAAAARRIEAARESISSYGPVHAEWFEDPDAVMPGEVLTHAASPEDRRRAYRRYGARFEVDGEGTLTLRLSLGLDGGALHPELSPL